jgi:PhnB protein
MQVSPYLFFDGRCAEAIDFYRAALGAEVAMVMQYKDCPEPFPGEPPPLDKIMHASLRIGSTSVSLSDGHCSGTANFQGFALTLTATDAAEAERLFAALSDGGQVRMPLGKTFFSPAFGMLADRFGVAWMVMVEPAA